MSYPSPKPKQRPAWWSPEEVLRRLLAGATAPDLCALAADECEGRLTPKHLRRDITTWAGSLTWGDQFTHALALWKYGGHDAGVLKLSDAWHDDFFIAMDREEGDVERAADLCGIGPELVYARLDKRNRVYDETFAERFRIAEGRRMARIRGAMLREAESDGKLAARVLESSMPALHASRQQVDVDARLDVTHTVKLAPEVVAASQARMRTLLSGRRRTALPDEGAEATGRVIELVANRVKAGA